MTLTLLHVVRDPLVPRGKRRRVVVVTPPKKDKWRSQNRQEIERVLPLIANIDTSRLWGTAATDADVRRHLETGDDDGPPADWSVGHFVNPVSIERGPAATISVAAVPHLQISVAERLFQIQVLKAHSDREPRGSPFASRPRSAQAPVKEALPSLDRYETEHPL